MIDIYIGYDSKEPIAFHVLAHSLLTRSSVPLRITPLRLQALRGLYWRKRGPLESTEFSMTRFLVPHLSGHTGWSIFLDCDMLCLTDPAALISYADDSKAVLVCQHDYVPIATTKFLDQPQVAYPRKNWSSLMLFNNARCRALTPDYVNTASGLDLHRLRWVDDASVGSLPLVWNWLIGEYADNRAAKIIHYTNGGPWFKDYNNCQRAADWWRELAALQGAT